MYSSFPNTKNCKIEKAFLFDMVSKLFIASDNHTVDITNFSMCFEMIDVYIDISLTYDEKHSNFDN